MEPGESWQAAVEREVLEETALNASCGGVIGWVERAAGNARYLIADFKIEAENIDKASPGDDATDLLFASRSQIVDLEVSPGLMEFLKRYRVYDL